jgi:hypothetical protein
MTRLLPAASAIWLRLRTKKSGIPDADTVAAHQRVRHLLDCGGHRPAADGLHIDLVDMAGQPRLEQEARAARRGLWALPEAQSTPPWEWRAAGRGGPGHATPPSSAPSANGSAAGAFTCGAKRYRREMTTCA